jgi:hypothetical protein
MNTEILRELNRFKNLMGYDCNIENPITFAEKIIHKKFFERSPLITLTSDKIKVKDFIEFKVGKEIVDTLFSHRLFSSYSTDFVIKNLENNIVIKPNNASGRNIFIENSSSINKERLKLILQNWLNISYGQDKAEWGYKNIKRGFVVEKIIGNNPINSLKFYVFKGETKYIFLHRYNNDKIIDISCYTPLWEYLPIKYNNWITTKQEKFNINLEYYVSLANKLGEDFSFSRIDFLIIDCKMFFSEITHYPTSGMINFSPKDFNFELGDYWV